VGGSGGGSGYRLTQRDVDQLRREAHERLERSKLDAEVNSFLQAELVRVNDRDAELANERLDRVEHAIAGQIEEFDRLLFGGSVAKHTYVDGLSDIDALVVLDASVVGDRGPAEMREELYEALRQHLSMGDVEDIRVGRMAVTVTFRDGMELQLLPAVQRDDRTAVSSQSGDEWSHVRPKDFAESLTRVNDEQGRSVVPTIKIAKAVVAEAIPYKIRPNGYHMEALAVAAFRGYEGSRSNRAMVERYFESAAQNILRPIRDITGQSQYLDSDLGPANSDSRRSLSRRFSAITRQMRAANSLDDWHQLLGD
jgi:Second Messenger Oligonucleotide or Dinucleotide Synthetase domain